MKRSSGIPLILRVITVVSVPLLVLYAWLDGLEAPSQVLISATVAAISALSLAESLIIGYTWETSAWTDEGRALGKFLLVIGGIICLVGLGQSALWGRSQLLHVLLVQCGAYACFFLCFFAGRGWQRMVSRRATGQE